MAEARGKGDHTFSHFGPEANLFAELEALFRDYGDTRQRPEPQYLHDDEEAAPYEQAPGHLHRLGGPARRHDLLFYEGLHGAVATDAVDVARHVDLLIGVVPVINLEWIQKLHRDQASAATPPRRSPTPSCAGCPTT